MTIQKHLIASLLNPVLFGGLLMLLSCSGTQNLAQRQAPEHASEIPDYSQLYYWAAHPYKSDPSDSTPAPYRNFEKDSSVDVFFIYPTSYTNDTAVDVANLGTAAENAKWNASVNDEALNKSTDNASILYQASVFNKYRVFAPRYRQAHLKAFYIPDSVARPFFDTAYADVLNAFEFYIEHYNKGRPFMIVSHSQGTLHAARLIRNRIENSPLVAQMIAAYIPGLPVPTDYFQHCKACEDEKQTGCVLSWRSFRSNYEPEYVLQEKSNVVVINPLSWTSSETIAPKQLNKGAVLFKFNKPKKRAVSAQVHGHILWVSRPRFFGSLFYTRKNYHIGDINLFWKNIRDNAEVRVAAYKKQYSVLKVVK